LRTLLPSLLLTLPALAGCGGEDTGSNPPSNTTPELLAPPPEGQGYQYKMVTHLGAGVEAEHCMFVKAPAEGMIVNRDEVRYSKGSHHFLLYQTDYDQIPTQKEDGTKVDTSGVFDCSDGATNGWKIKRLVGGSQNASGTSMLSFPPDVGVKVPPGAVLLMNTHYVNASTEALDPEVRINLWTIPEAQMKQEGDLLFMYNAFIHVPANGEGKAHMRCNVFKDITIQNVQSHMHRRGVDYAAMVTGQDPFYTNTKWEGVPVKDFGQGLQVKAGSQLEYWCDYKNAEAREVYQGPRSTDEMCMLIGSYYPADPATANCMISPDQPGTGNIGAEWIGNGKATCKDTFACVQQSFGGGFSLEKMTDCLMASDPAVSKEMSDSVRCLILNLSAGKDPATACQTEFAACQAK
jgi:hypothetical protein